MSKKSPKSTTKGYKCLVFDTETTGLRDDKKTIDKKVIFNPKWNNDKKEKKWLPNPKLGEPNPDYHIPHILQLSYILYDSKDPKNPKIYNKYIDDILDDDSIKIQPKAFETHHISKDDIQDKKDKQETVSMKEALEEFFNDIKGVQYIVGHNVQFDIDRLKEELERVKDPSLKNTHLNTIDNWSSYVRCTLEDNVNTCKLNKSDKQKNFERAQQKRDPSYSPKYIYKVPKLSETYEHYFRYKPNEAELHDAIMDVVLTLRVFLYGEFKVDVCSESETIRDYLSKITPDDISLNDHGCSIQHQLFIKNSPEEKNVETMKSRSKTKKSLPSLDIPDVSEVTMNVDTSKTSKSRGGKRRKSRKTIKIKRRKKKSL